MGRGRKSRRNQNQVDKAIKPDKSKPVIFPTAIYVRLSVENLGIAGNTTTIENQKDVCREFVKNRPDLQLVKIYEDNGWSGTVMQRPAFDELMEDVKNGVIKAIVVRDLSRFARNYIDSGEYLASVFPELGVRFISIKEGLDTLNVKSSESFIVSLHSIINYFYSKDISRKVETAVAIRMKNGTKRWAVAPYGYKKVENSAKIVPDPVRADIVRQIFQWKLEGVTTRQIVRTLNEINAPKSDVSYCQEKPWNTYLVSTILKNSTYIGTRILGKEHTAIYKGIYRERTTPDEWHIFQNNHEPIISTEIFEEVQRIMNKEAEKFHDSVKRTEKHRAKLIDLFKGKIFCADCGYPMYYNRFCRNHKTQNWAGRYVCSSYQSQRTGNKCSIHFFSQRILEEKVLAVIQTHIKIGLDYEKLIASFQGSKKDKEKRHNFDMAIRRATQKLALAQRKRARLYEDYVAEILDTEEYLFAKKSYDEEVEKWNNELDRLVAENNAYKEAMSPKNLWVKVMRSVKNIKKLTQELVDATIERIEIYEGGDFHIVMKYQDIFELTKRCLEGDNDA